jgi:hypothetical protein
MGFELSAMAINPYDLNYIVLTTYYLLKPIYEDLSERFSRKKAKLKQQSLNHAQNASNQSKSLSDEVFCMNAQYKNRIMLVIYLTHESLHVAGVVIYLKNEVIYLNREVICLNGEVILLTGECLKVVFDCMLIIPTPQSLFTIFCIVLNTSLPSSRFPLPASNLITFLQTIIMAIIY